MPDHILSPVEDDDDPINDAQRLTFSRRLLCQMSRDEDGGGYDHFNCDPNYPSVAMVELTDSQNVVYFAVLLIPQGNYLRDRLAGVFAQVADGKNALSDQGYATLWGSDEERLSDEAILAYWNR
jgi:hypothetical protein